MYNLNLIIYFNIVVEKIKDEKGEFWCNFTNVRKLNGPFSMPRAFVVSKELYNKGDIIAGYGSFLVN
jgi:beta-xylosidase